MLRAAAIGLFASSVVASAQVATTWTLDLDQSPFSDMATDAVVGPDGTTTYVGGLSNGQNHPESTVFATVDAAIARVDPQGTLLWIRRHAPSLLSRTLLEDVESAPSGNIVATGNYAPTQTGGAFGAVTVAYSPSGTLLWSVLAPGSRAVRLAVDTNSDVWVVGTGYTPATSDDVFVQRINAAGEVVFTRRWNGSANTSDEGLGIAPDGAGGAYVTGRTNWPEPSELIVLRYDASGTLLWARTPNLGQRAFGAAVAVDTAGDAIVGGGEGNAPWTPVLVKYDAAGHLQWQTTSPVVGYWRFVAIDPRGDSIGAGVGNVEKRDPLGNLVWRSVAGSLWVDALAVDGAGEIALAGKGANVARAARIDRDGGLVWARDFGAPGNASSGQGVGFGPAGSVFAAAQTGQEGWANDQDVTVARFDEASVPFCFGDGSGTTCPCGNATPSHERAGCASSLGIGGRLTADGSASLGNDTLTLRGSGMPNASALYFQGTTQSGGGAGTVFGDGLRCAGGAIVRLKTVTNSAGASQFPAAGDPSVSVRGQIAGPGTLTYQVWYRNAAAFCTSETFNLTNGVRVTWTN